MKTFGRAVCVVVCGFMSAPLAAQGNFELGPLFGYYLPVGSFAPASEYLTSLPTKPSDLSGTAWGVEGRVGFGNRWGVQVQAAEANSTIRAVISPEGPMGPTPAQVSLMTVEAQYELLASPGAFGMSIGAGPGVVRHGGQAYSEAGVTPATNVGAALGVRMNWRVVSHLHATTGIGALLYQLNVPLPPDARLNPGKLESGFQTDLLLHIGLAWSWR